MSTFRMLVGLPGSGKSVFAKQFEGSVIHSSDELRKEMFGDVNRNDKASNTELFQELHRLMIADLKTGKDVVFDATNINSKRRREFLDKIDCRKECYIVATPYSQCIKNNQNRDRKVPVDVIKRMYMNWQTPFWFEGWNHIQITYPFERKKKDVHEWLLKFWNYNQMNSHHKLGLGHHCFLTGEYNQNSEILKHAGFLHDCGKPFTRTIKDEEGHYYQHHCVGGYETLFFNVPVDVLELSALVSWHMQPYFWKDEEKYKELWGTDFFMKICNLHLADREAH